MWKTVLKVCQRKFVGFSISAAEIVTDLWCTPWLPTAEKSDCSSLLDSLSLDDPLVARNRVGVFSCFLLFWEEHPYKSLSCWGPVQFCLFSQNCRVLMQIIINWQTPFWSHLLEGKPRFRKPCFGMLTWPCILFTFTYTIIFLQYLFISSMYFGQ